MRNYGCSCDRCGCAPCAAAGGTAATSRAPRRRRAASRSSSCRERGWCTVTASGYVTPTASQLAIGNVSGGTQLAVTQVNLGQRQVGGQVLGGSLRRDLRLVAVPARLVGAGRERRPPAAPTRCSTPASSWPTTARRSGAAATRAARRRADALRPALRQARQDLLLLARLRGVRELLPWSPDAHPVDAIRRTAAPRPRRPLPGPLRRLAERPSLLHGQRHRRRPRDRELGLHQRQRAAGSSSAQPARTTEPRNQRRGGGSPRADDGWPARRGPTPAGRGFAPGTCRFTGASRDRPPGATRSAGRRGRGTGVVVWTGCSNGRSTRSKNGIGGTGDAGGSSAPWCAARAAGGSRDPRRRLRQRPQHGRPRPLRDRDRTRDCRRQRPLGSQRGIGEVVQGSITEAPFPAERFDFAVCLDVLEHIDDEVAVLRELRRMVRGGRHPPGDGAGVPVALERARRDQPPQAPLHARGGSRRSLPRPVG